MGRHHTRVPGPGLEEYVEKAAGVPGAIDRARQAAAGGPTSLLTVPGLLDEVRGCVADHAWSYDSGECMCGVLPKDPALHVAEEVLSVVAARGVVVS